MGNKFLSYMGLIFPWQYEKSHDNKILNKLAGKIPSLQTCPGLQGLGESFSFLVNPNEKWAISQYMATLYALAIIFFVISFEEKELKNMTNYVLQIIEAFVKRKGRDSTVPCISLSLLCKYKPIFFFKINVSPTLKINKKNLL